MLTDAAFASGWPERGPDRSARKDVTFDAPISSIELRGELMSLSRNAEVYGESEPADYLYKVVSGAVRTYKILLDGRRQIGAFYLPGDMFGLETGEEHALSAEAVTLSKILVIKRAAVVSLAGRAIATPHP